MTDTNAITNVAIDLTEILRLWGHLLTQAVHEGANPDMPGGAAMIALGPVSNHEAWGNMQQATERYARAYTSPEDETDEPPLQRVTFWSERWRAVHGAEYGQTPTVATEVNFIRYNLNWAAINEPQWGMFTDDMHAARMRLEAILLAGDRDVISSDVTCLLCETELRRRMGPNGIEDEWWCKTCRQHLTQPQFNLAASEAGRRKFNLT